ncbi:glycine cleavage system protein R [Paraferrimonas sedimenticola]|uniref:Glycine cleavage system transcriptional repressor n=1 Tax=Paraferrimonas sedimenticola TaxID=375674 RepID=A0AA37RNM7_9GAMM|nr:ACT domain-containing protein [Paraferrimonas sedimenticola]GLP94763.1 glycine cleavage system protein R [Paraferrimonas sedimenticola]
MTDYLVVTAMGSDRPGIVNRFTRLASECDCNIVDSRMALYGSEFTLSLMLSGEYSAITRIENALPPLSVELELHTIIKRTQSHTALEFIGKLDIALTGPDKRGTMSRFTQYFAEQQLDLAALRTQTLDKGQQELHFSLNLPPGADSAKVCQDIQTIAEEMSLSCQCTAMDIQSSE